MSAKAERRAAIALLAVFALLVQALIPSLASAAPAGDPTTIICTAEGPQTAPNGSGQPPAEHGCKHCLCMAPAPTALPPPALEFHAVAYARAEAPHAAPPQRLRPPARAPPRPPGQGPPASEA